MSFRCGVKTRSYPELCQIGPRPFKKGIDKIPKNSKGASGTANKPEIKQGYAKCQKS